MASLRTKDIEESYQKYIAEGGLEKGCILCGKKSLKDFNYWFISENDFPYGRIASVHHMIIPKRHAVENKLSEKEKGEFKKIKEGYIKQNYEFIMEATDKVKTIPSHFHLHLLVVKN